MNISIGIPFYNAEKYLEDAICSVLAQSYKDWELILVDDGSTDTSLSIAKKYANKDKRIRVLSDGKNKKLPTRLNQIVDESKYDYIARMDADDLMSNDRLEKQILVLESNNKIDFVSTGCLTIGKNNELTGWVKGKNYQMDAVSVLQGSTNILHASLLARKSWYLRNKYNKDIIQAEDFDLWLQAAKNNDLKYTVIEEPLYWYRVVENVTIEKIVNGYNAQIDIISNNYNGFISSFNKNKIVTRFIMKKIIARTLNKISLLDILLKRRSGKYENEQLIYYHSNFINIKKFRVKK